MCNIICSRVAAEHLPAGCVLEGCFPVGHLAVFFWAFKGLSFCFFYFLSRDQFFVIVTKIWSRWQKIGCDDNWNCRVTNFLSSWQKFGHDDNWNCRMTNFLSSWQKIGFETLIKSRWSSTRILVHWSNPHHHQVCLDIDKIPINIHQGRLDMNEIPIIIIKDAWAWMKFICMSSGILNCLNTDLLRRLIFNYLIKLIFKAKGNVSFVIVF